MTFLALTMTSGCWLTNEEVEKDLLHMAEYNFFPENFDTSTIKVPDSIVHYNQMVEENQKRRIQVEVDEKATYVACGRGRGIKDRVIKPGEDVQHHPLDDVDLKKRVREVSGLGYSNELCYQSIMANAYEPSASDSSDLFFSSSSSSDSGSSKSSPKRTNKTTRLILKE